MGNRWEEGLAVARRGRGVEFLALSMDESDEVIKGWRQQNDVSFPLARLDDVTKRSFFGDASTCTSTSAQARVSTAPRRSRPRP